MFAIVLLILKFLLFGVIAGIGITILVSIPLVIYATPYLLWVGFQNNVGKQKDKKNEGLLSSVKNATRLYKCWIKRQQPEI